MSFFWNMSDMPESEPPGWVDGNGLALDTLAVVVLVHAIVVEYGLPARLADDWFPALRHGYCPFDNDIKYP